MRYSPILETLPSLPETEFSSEYTETLFCYIIGPSMVKYGILTTFQGTTTLSAMKTKIFVLDSQSSRQIGDHGKL